MNALHGFYFFKKNYYVIMKMTFILCVLYMSVTQLAFASENVIKHAKFKISSQISADASENIRNNQYNKRSHNVRSYGGGSTARDGSIDVYVDPETGDRVTKVTPPRHDNTQQQNPPIVVYPTIDPRGYLPGQNVRPTPVPIPTPPLPPVRPSPTPSP